MLTRKCTFFFRGKLKWRVNKLTADLTYTTLAEHTSRSCTIDETMGWRRKATLTSGLLSDLEVRRSPCFLPTFLTPQVRSAVSSSFWLSVRTAWSSWSVLFRGFIIYLWPWWVKYPLQDAGLYFRILLHSPYTDWSLPLSQSQAHTYFSFIGLSILLI